MNNEEQQGNPAPPFSLRLTPEERAWLNAEAGRMPLGLYIRERLFNSPTLRKRNFRRPIKDEQSLANLLAEMGRSRLSSNLNQLAKAVHSGSLPVTPETEKALQNACAEIQKIRQDLLKALGLLSE